MHVVEETYFTVEEVAERLKVSRMSVYRWIKTGQLDAYKLGGEFRISEEAVERFLEAHRFRGKGGDNA